MSGLSVQQISKSYGETRALDSVSMKVDTGEVVALLGPSGSGKSTLLYIIAGLEPSDAGQVLWNGSSLAGVPPHRRGFGLMFQDFALFPHRNVYDNVAFALQMARRPRQETQARVDEMLALVGLPGFSRRDVNTLSGGEQQRIALARALAPHPRLLMLDEPLGSLDRALRERLVNDLARILRQMEQTAVYVTHDQEEAFTIADRVVIMNAGRIAQSGAPQEIYLKPASVFVARFLGMENLLPGTAAPTGKPGISTPVGVLPVSPEGNGALTVLLRPDAARLDGQGDFSLEGTVVETSFRGSTCRATVQVNSSRLRFNFPSQVILPSKGEPIRLAFDTRQAVQVFPEPHQE
jgi:ABC-type Fe3+/spermidine/putrescine transport system ATPase subunit